MVLVEVDDLFGHEPLPEATAALLEAFTSEAERAGRYHFRKGRELAQHARNAGLAVVEERELADRELAFDGPALPAVVEAWDHRFQRMGHLARFCGRDFEQVRDDFLATLRREDHRARCRVIACVASVPPDST